MHARADKVPSELTEPDGAAREAERKRRIEAARRDVWAVPQNLRVFAELAKR